MKYLYKTIKSRILKALCFKHKWVVPKLIDLNYGSFHGGMECTKCGHFHMNKSDAIANLNFVYNRGKLHSRPGDVWESKLEGFAEEQGI